jgi:hypothetical protein
MTDETVLPPVERFFARLAEHLAHSSLAKLVLAKHQREPADLARLTVRPLRLREQAHLSFVYSHATRDITHNHPVNEGVAKLRDLIGPAFRHAHLLAAGEDLELRFTKKGPKRTTARNSATCCSTRPSSPRSASPRPAASWCRRWRASGSRSTSSSRSWTTHCKPRP